MNSSRFLLGLLSAAVPAALIAAPTKPETRIRAEIPAQYRWDFSAIYPDWAAWDAGMKDMEVRMDAFAAMKGTLKNGPAAVLKAYQAFDEIGMMRTRSTATRSCSATWTRATRRSRANSSASVQCSPNSARRPHGSRPKC